MLPLGSFSYTSSTQVPAFLLVILAFLVFPRAPLFLVCCLGHSPHVSRTVAGLLHFKQVVNRLKIPHGLSTPLFHRWSEVPSSEESVVIHHKKNYRLYKDATCHNLWPCDLTDVTTFSSLFF